MNLDNYQLRSALKRKMMATSMSRRNISSSANNYQKCKPLSNLDKKRTNQQLRNKEKKRTMMA